MRALNLPIVAMAIVSVLCAVLGARMMIDRKNAAESAAVSAIEELQEQAVATRARESQTWAQSFESAKQRAFEAGLAEGQALTASEAYPTRLLEKRRLEFRDQGKAMAAVVSAELHAEHSEVHEKYHPAILTTALETSAASASSPWWWGVVGGLLSCALIALWWRKSVISPLARLAVTMDDVADGGESRVPPLATGPDAVRNAQAAFNRTADALSATRRDLQVAVDRKTSALGAALEESQALNDRLRAVLEELETTQLLLASREKLAALGTFAGGVAHEFNNILGGIRGCTRDLLQDELDQDQRETLEVIERAAERGRTIVDGLSQFSKGGERTAERISLWAVVQEVIALLGPSGTERGVTLHAHRGPGTHNDSIEANPIEMHQVLVNLVSNALQHAPQQSEVVVELQADSALPNTHSKEARVSLSVSDTGPGVPPEDVKSLFLPFFTTREREGGTGLGLAISHGLIRAARGELSFQPNPGGGAQFVISLPLIDEDTLKEPS